MTFPPISIPRSAGWDTAAPETLRVMVAWPEQPPPPAGHPVLCVLDADTLFGTAVEAARLQAGRPGATGVVPAVVVGLSHAAADRAARVAARRRDYTPPPFDGKTGGADAFLDRLEAEILPGVERVAAIDRTRMALFGHSIAGLLPVHALLTRTALFRCCVAASPSLWWEDGVLLRQAEAFAARPPTRARLLLTVGGLERPSVAVAARDPARAARLQDARMVDNVHALATCLAPVVDTRCVEFPDENHGSVLPGAISRAVAFALGEW